MAKVVNTGHSMPTENQQGTTPPVSTGSLPQDDEAYLHWAEEKLKGVYETCSDCQGTGWDVGSNNVCPTCMNDGRIPRNDYLLAERELTVLQRRQIGMKNLIEMSGLEVEAALVGTLGPTIEEAGEEILLGAFEICEDCRGTGGTVIHDMFDQCSQCAGHGQRMRDEYKAASRMLNQPIPELPRSEFQTKMEVMTCTREVVERALKGFVGANITDSTLSPNWGPKK